MKLRTSFFDHTVFRKDITRFAPLWALYFIGGLLVMMTLTDSDAGYYAASSVGETIGPFAIINIIYAALAVQVLFGDLYNARLCNALHAMPMRRENWFFTHVLAGLCFSLVPNAVGIFFVMFQMQQFWFVAFIWLLGMTLQYLFFFGLGVLCAMCAGNRIAMAALYGITNFASVLLAGFCELVYVPMMYGITLDMDGFVRFCPVAELARNNDFVLWERQLSGTGYTRYFDGFGQGWGYLGVLAALGVVFLAAGLLLYRRRRLECAGDFIAVRPLAPVFSVVFSLCVGAVFGLFGELVDSSYVPYLILGIFVGWFVGRMLLARTVKVFRGKEVLWPVLVVAVLFVSIFLVQVDVFGIVRWTPLTEQVQSVTIANFQSSVYGYDGVYGGSSISVDITDPAVIKKVIDAHEDILSRQNEENVSSRHRAVFVYQLKNGKTVRRSYNAPASGKNYEILSELFYTAENVLGFDSWKEGENDIDYLVVADQQVTDKDRANAVMQTLRQDFDAGHVFFSSKTDDPVIWVEYHYRRPDGENIRRYLVVTKGAKLLNLIKSPVYALGYADKEEFLKWVSGVRISDGLFVEGEELGSFATALFADFAKGNVTLEVPEKLAVKLEYGQKDGSVERQLYVSDDAVNIKTWLKSHYPSTSERSNGKVS